MKLNVFITMQTVKEYNALSKYKHNDILHTQNYFPLVSIFQKRIPFSIFMKQLLINWPLKTFRSVILYEKNLI